MPHNRIDLSLGISWRAMAVLHALHDMEENMEGWKEGNSRGAADIQIHTYAFYDGRERGICLEVREIDADNLPNNQECMLIAFAESRGSDQVFVQQILRSKATPRYGGVDLSDFPEESYQDRCAFDDIEDAAMHVMGQLAFFAMRKAA